MNENEFWIALWRTAGAIVVCIVAVASGCVSYNNTIETTRIAEAIKTGVEPLAARCAISGYGDSRIPMCAVIASKP